MVNDFLTVAEPLLYPALPADPNKILPPDLSQISAVIITPCDAVDPFVNDGSGNISLVAGEIDNTNTDNTKSKQLTVEGGIPEHEVVEIPGPNGTVLIPAGGRTFEPSLRCIISQDEVYEYLRTHQSGQLDFRFWLIDRGGYLYGPVLEADATTYGGIRPAYVNVQFPKGSGPDDYGYADLILRFRADADPQRYDSPITLTDGCVPSS